MLYKTTKIAIKAAIAAIIKNTGLASIVVFKAAIAPLTAVIAVFTIGRILIMLPTAETILPITISTGPIAATIPVITKITF